MREYPAAPLVGVGAVVVDGERVLLVHRGQPPGVGRWSLPRGLVEVGEPLEAAVLDYLATPTAGRPEAGSDALAVEWREAGALDGPDVTEGLEAMVRRALAMDVERRQREEKP